MIQNMIKVKKRTLGLVGLLMLMFTVNVYANEIIPTNIQRNELENGVKEIVKVYELDRSQELIVDINSFVEGDVEYNYFATDSTEIVETDEKEITHTVQIETLHNKRDNLLTYYDLTIDYTTDDGYQGTLALQEETLNTEVKGYVTKYYQVYENRTYPNLPSNDVAFIPKTINVNGYGYTMSNIGWTYNSNFAENSIIPDTYTASATYERTASSQNATGYITTVEYKGMGTKKTKDVVKYEVRFRTEPIEVIEVVEEVEVPESTESETSSSKSIVGVILITVFLLVIMAIFAFIYIKFLHPIVKEKVENAKMKKQIKKNMMNDIELEESVDEYFNNTSSADSTDDTEDIE